MYPRYISVLLLALGLAGSVLGQETAPPANPDSALVSALNQIEGQTISLSVVIEKALAQSTQARDAEAALAAARGALMRERGTFDPELYGDLSKSSAKIPSDSPFSGADVLHPQTTAGEFGARMTLPVGTELQASVTAQKLETNSIYASLNPEYDASSSLTVRQPLLQGFGPAAWGNFSKARNDYEAARHRYEDAIAGVRFTAESMYWDLYEAERDLAVARLTNDQASAFMEQVQARANAGLVGPNQVNSAKVFQAQQQFVRLDAEDNLSRTSDALASLIGERVGVPSRRYRTVDEPRLNTAPAPEDSLVAKALRTNHAFLATEWDVEATRAQAKAAWWNALPRLDVFGALGGNGLSGTGRDVVFGSEILRNDLNTRFPEALDQALKRDYPSWTIGLHAVIPILLREKSGERNRWHAELTRAEQRHERTKRDLEDQVRATYREVLHGRGRQEAAQVGVEAATNQVRIGLIEYANGRTTAFELVRLGADLADAQRRYSQALVRTAKAEAQLKQLVPEE